MPKKRGESDLLDSPLKVWITNRYPKWILSSHRLNHGGIRCKRHHRKKRISQKFSGFEKLLLVGEICRKKEAEIVGIISSNRKYYTDNLRHNIWYN
jgi:hypothetical protein